jgi:hypothetical protein
MSTMALRRGARVYEECLSKGLRNGGCKSRPELLLEEVLRQHCPSSLLSIGSASPTSDHHSSPLASDLASVLSLAACLLSDKASIISQARVIIEPTLQTSGPPFQSATLIPGTQLPFTSVHQLVAHQRLDIHWVDHLEHTIHHARSIRSSHPIR